MFWTSVRHSSSPVVQKGTPSYFRSRTSRCSSVAPMGSASGAELAERAFSERAFRESYHPYCNGYGDSSASSAQNLRANGAVQLPCSTSTPCFMGCGSRLLPRRFSQQLHGPQLSPSALQRDLELTEERATRGPLTYVMLPLDTVNAEGIFRYAGSTWFSQALHLLVASGAHGVAMDFWWGAVERKPGQYNWAGYKQALEVIKQTGLKVQAVLSFHACGGNVGDTVQIPLPEWVLQCGESDPDLFFTDRPRNGGLGNRNREYISIWADDAPGVLRGRSPVQCYEDLMVSLRESFSQELGTVIDEVVVGTGPCGELRLPSYVEANGWRFPGAGEFQCYDRRALASLAQAAREAGHPEWGYTGPHNAGEYNSLPEHTGFFSQNGSWNTPYGRFFLEWYSTCLLKHGERLLAAANQAFASKLGHPIPPGLQQYGSGGFGAMAMPGSGIAASQPFQFLLHNGSSGRASTMSLNRILETGAYGSTGMEPGSSIHDCTITRPPSMSLPRRQADGITSISPSCTCSSISTCTTSSSSGTGSSGAGSQTGSLVAANGGAALAAQLSSGGGGVNGSGGAASPRRLVAAALGPRVSGGGGAAAAAATSMSDPGAADVVGVVLGRRAVAAQAVELLQVPETECIGSGGGGGGDGGRSSSGDGAGGGGSSRRNASSGSNTIGAGGLGSGGVLDTVMIDVEPSEASHTSTIAAESLQGGRQQPGAGPCSEPLCQAPNALPIGGPSPLAAAGRFRSSASTFADPEPMYGQGTAFAAAAAAAGAILASAGGGGGTTHMDSLSSLSTEYHAGSGGGGGGGGLQTASMLYMEVASSLVADCDDESDVGNSCGTGVQEEPDDLFAMATNHTLSQAANSSFGDEGSRGSADLAAMGMGMGAAAMPPPPAMAMQLASPTASCLVGPSSGSVGGAGLHLALKIAGIHWWYRSRSHAAELTAGYYNVEGRDGYAPIVDLCARQRANLVLTCVEMCDSQHPVVAQCGPEGLLRQLRQLAARAGVALSGENALPIFSTGGVDTDALDRIVRNMRPLPVSGSGRIGISPAPSLAQPHIAATAFVSQGGTWPPLQLQQQHHSAFSYPSVAATAATAVAGNNIVGVSYRMSESGRPIPVYSGGAATATLVQDAHPQAAALWSYPSLESQFSAGGHLACPSPAAAAAPPPQQQEVLPALRAFTFLRLVPEMLLPGYQSLWMQFMGKMTTTTS